MWPYYSAPHIHTLIKYANYPFRGIWNVDKISPILKWSKCLGHAKSKHIGKYFTGLVIWCTGRRWFKAEPGLLPMNRKCILAYFKIEILFSVMLMKTSSGNSQFAIVKVDKYHPHMCNITSYMYFPQHLDQST